MRVWHSAWSWLKLIVAAESVAGNTRTGMLTRLIFRKPFQVGRAAMQILRRGIIGRIGRIHTFAQRGTFLQLVVQGAGCRVQGSGSRFRVRVRGSGFGSDEPEPTLNLEP